MKNFKLIFAVLGLLSLGSCIVDNDDETLEEMSSTPYTIGFKNSVANESYFEDEGSIPRTYLVNIIGGKDGSNPSEDIILNYSINETASTAEEGREFDFVQNTGQIVIPAGTNFGEFEILLNTGNLDPNKPTVLVLDLESTNSADSVIVENNKSLSITFVGCNSQIAQPGNQGLYLVELVRDDGVTYSGVETITWTGPNNFQTESTGIWGVNTIAPDTSMDFEDVCGEISVPNQNLAQGFYSNEVYGVNLSGPDGTVDQNTLSFEMSYYITFSAGPRLHTVTYTRQN